MLDYLWLLGMLWLFSYVSKQFQEYVEVVLHFVHFLKCHLFLLHMRRKPWF